MIPLKSADKCYHTTKQKDLVVGGVCSKTPSNMADTMLSFVFPGDLHSPCCHEHCAGREVLVFKDHITMVELVSYEWNGHW